MTAAKWMDMEKDFEKVTLLSFIYKLRLHFLQSASLDIYDVHVRARTDPTNHTRRAAYIALPQYPCCSNAVGRCEARASHSAGGRPLHHLCQVDPGSRVERVGSMGHRGTHHGVRRMLHQADVGLRGGWWVVSGEW